MKKFNLSKLLVTVTFLFTLFFITPSVYAVGGNGMTWVKLSHDNTLGIDQVNCNSGAPDGCNAYEGETSCKLSRPVLCIKVDHSLRPPYKPSGSGYYDGWAGGHIATTMPIQGIALSTPKAGDRFCQATFGDGWRMAEFHDNRGGGWGFRAYGNVRNDQRFWVKNKDQPANCWNP